MENTTQIKVNEMEGKIFTSRFSNHGIVDGEVTPVQISLGAPRFRTGYTILARLYDLAPGRAWMNARYDDYKKKYLAQMHEKGFSAVVDMLYEVFVENGRKPLVLLCFEDVRNPEDFCHRRIWADWYEDLTGNEVPELYDPSPDKWHDKGKTRQMSLFDI